MSRRRRLAVAAELALGLTFAGTLLIATTSDLSRWGILALAVASLAPMFDIFDLGLRLRWRAEAQPSVDAKANPSSERRGARRREWMAVASVYNAAPEIPDFLANARSYRDRLWLIDDASTDDTATILRMRGVRCVRADVNRHKPGALRDLLGRLPAWVEAVVVLDPDTRLTGQDGGPPPLDAVIDDLFARDLAAICPVVTVARENLLTSLQHLEYTLAVRLGRAALGEYGVTSGISVYRRDRLEAALSRHSLSVYAEDLENAVLLLSAGHGITLDERLVAHTEGKTTLRGLFSQRIGWAFGHLRVYWTRRTELAAMARRSPVAFYQYLVYLGVMGVVLHPLRQLGALLVVCSLLGTLAHVLGAPTGALEALAGPEVFGTIYAQYSVLGMLAMMAAVPARQRLRTIPVVMLYPLYALALTVPVSIGFLNWITVSLWKRRLVADHFDDLRRIASGRTPVRRRPLPGGPSK